MDNLSEEVIRNAHVCQNNNGYRRRNRDGCPHVPACVFAGIFIEITVSDNFCNWIFGCHFIPEATRPSV
jgi:hypothetical protein